MKLSEIASASSSALVAFYNEKSGKPAIKKFADRKTAEKRVAALIESLPAPAKPKKVEKNTSETPKAKTLSIGDSVTLPASALEGLPKGATAKVTGEDGGFIEVEITEIPKGSGKLYKVGERVSVNPKTFGFPSIAEAFALNFPDAPAKPKKVENKTSEATSNRKGRKSAYSGKIIRRATEGGKNPRREGTWGYKSFELIPSEGIEYDAYISAGGRNNDFLWDLARGFVTVG